MATALVQEKFYTIHDIYDLPDGERAELVDGQIYFMAPPNRKHLEIAGELFGIIREYIRSKHGSCRPYVAPFAVFQNKDETNFVDPEKSHILVYKFDLEDIGDYTFTDSVKAGIYEDLYINFADISELLNR